MRSGLKAGFGSCGPTFFFMLLACVLMPCKVMAGESAASLSVVPMPSLWKHSAQFERIWRLGTDPAVTRRELKEVESHHCRIDSAPPREPLPGVVRATTVLNEMPVQIAVSLWQGPERKSGSINSVVEIESGDRATEYWITSQFSEADGSSPLRYRTDRTHFVRLGPCPSEMKPGDFKRISCKITGAVDWSCE